MAAFTIITQPVAEPVTTAEAKEALRVLTSDDDTRIDGITKTSREFTEKYCDVYLMTTVIELSLDYWPVSNFGLMTTPLQSIDSIKYDDTGSPSVENTLIENVDYYADILMQGGHVYPIKAWPRAAQKPNAIRIRMTAGYLSAAEVPEIFKDGIKTYNAYLYDQNPDLEKAAKSILWPRRIL